MLVKPGSIQKVNIKPKCPGKAQISKMWSNEGFRGFMEVPRKMMQSSVEVGEAASAENLTCLLGSIRCTILIIQKASGSTLSWLPGL